MTEPSSTPDPSLQGAGLSATSTTADQMSPGDPSGGATYGDPGGTGSADQESAAGSDEDLGMPPTGNSEGGSGSSGGALAGAETDAVLEGDDPADDPEAMPT